jgi:hypothetical protein
LKFRVFVVHRHPTNWINRHDLLLTGEFPQLQQGRCLSPHLQVADPIRLY